MAAVVRFTTEDREESDREPSYVQARRRGTVQKIGDLQQSYQHHKPVLMDDRVTELLKVAGESIRWNGRRCTAHYASLQAANFLLRVIHRCCSDVPPERAYAPEVLLERFDAIAEAIEEADGKTGFREDLAELENDGTFLIERERAKCLREWPDQVDTNGGGLAGSDQDSGDVAAVVNPAERDGHERWRSRGRDLLWLKWHNDGMKPAEIRDRWNDMSDSKRASICPRNSGQLLGDWTKTLPRVAKAIKRAKERLEQESS